MPTSGPTAVPPAPGPSASLATASSHVSKTDAPVKQIAICAIQSSGSAPAAPQTRATGASGQFISPAGAVTSLGFMINRFAPEGRQAVLLQPRGSTGQPVVVTTSSASSTPARYQIQIPQHHTIRTIVPAVAPVSRNNSIQLMNLSVSNPSAGQVHHAKVATGSRPFGTFPLESMGLVIQNSSDTAVRPMRVQAAGQTVTAKTIAARAPHPKVINLTTGNSLAATPGRHNILLGTTTAGTASGKPAILNLNKSGPAVIINPNSAVQLNSNTATGNFNSHLTPHPANKPSLIPVNSAVMTIAAGQLPRHHPIGTASATPFPTSQRIITSSQQQQPPQQPHIVSISGSPALKSPAVTANSSPVKQQIPPSTPSSPRPSILNRKRVVPDSRPLLTPTKGKQETGVSLGHRSVAEVAEEESTTGAGGLPADQQPTTPRKKPRKQLLEPFDLSAAPSVKLNNCDDEKHLTEEQREEEDEEHEEEEPADEEIDQEQDHEETDDASQEEMDCDEDEEDEDEEDEEEEFYSASSPPNGRKPRISLFPFHPPNWKALQHHFLRYTDVKPKAEKKMTLSELSNEGLQKKNGWKIHHLATQMEDMSENESELLQRLNQCLHSFEERVADLPPMRESLHAPFPVTVGDKLVDLLRGNIQRSSLFQEQMAESKQLLIKLTNDHRERVGKLTRKNINKRTCISK